MIASQFFAQVQLPVGIEVTVHAKRAQAQGGLFSLIAASPWSRTLPTCLRMMRLACVAARPEKPKNDEDGCHVTAGDECRDEGTHWNLSLLDDSSFLHRLCRANGRLIMGNCR